MWTMKYKDVLKGINDKWKFRTQLLMGPGPVNCSLRTRQALSVETLTPVSEDIYKIMDDIQAMLKYIFQTENKLTLAQQNAAHGGLESIITNIVDPGQKMIIAVGGVWGKRTLNMAQNYGIEVVELNCGPGEVFSFEYLEDQIKEHRPLLLLITHGESSTGTLQPLDGLGSICHKYNCLLAIDAVASFGGVPLFIDKWEIDAVAAGSQKAISAPAGMVFLSFSERAEQLIRAKKVPPPLYFDVLALSYTWNCFGKPRRYHYTFGNNILMGVREALLQIIEEGVVEAWQRHKMCAERLWRGLEKLGLEIFVKNEKYRLYTVTPVCIPADVKWPVLLEYILRKYDIDIGFGVGPTAHKCIRIGCMCYNAQPENVDFVLAALQDGLKYCRSNEGRNGPNSRSEVLE